MSSESVHHRDVTRYTALLCALLGKQRTLPRGVCCLVSDVKPVRQIALLLYGFSVGGGAVLCMVGPTLSEQ